MIILAFYKTFGMLKKPTGLLISLRYPFNLVSEYSKGIFFTQITFEGTFLFTSKQVLECLH